MDHILLDCPTLPPNTSREEKNKQEYGPWLAVDTKYHEDSELLLTMKMDESGQITHINHIHADHLERSEPGRKLHGPSVTTIERRKKTTPRYRLVLGQSRQPASPPYRCTSAAQRNWKNKQHHDMKRKLTFDTSDTSSKAINGVEPIKE
ncbi:hypothetical protein M9H77_23294 [Catharanthus roseus]|uniref:Uncharacterized protein n=1 Tax=Catharanthus roseus TaxID=4058 RepID=A0ACC0ATA7_CATRO|nr:hypothetical protein M9H77_23294 [Catharanthus roseus]